MRNGTQELAFPQRDTPGVTIEGSSVESAAADDLGAARPSARSRRFLDDHSVLVSFFFVCVATSIAFAPQLFNDAVFPWDFLGSASTAPPFVAESIADGRWPTWSNFVGSGQMLSIDAQSGLYYPLWWILGVLDVPLSVTFLAKIHVAHVAIGGFGMALLARARGVRALFIPMAAVAFVMFGGFYSQAQHVTHFRGFALFPWLLWCLTFPQTGVATRRLVWLPLIVWMAVAGIYPGQIVSFAVLGTVYLGFEFWPRRRELSVANYRTMVFVAMVSVGVAATILAPYLLVATDPELFFRPFPPTATNLDIGSLQAHDLFGAFVSPWGFDPDGSIHSMYVGAPVLIGLSGLSVDYLRRQRSLVGVAVVAFVFAGMGSIDIVADAMLRVDAVFASRFPIADYKIGFVVPALVFSAIGWSALLQGRVRAARPLTVALLLGCALWLARDVADSDPASRWPWLLLVIVATTIVAVAGMRREVLAVGLLLVLVGYEGVRAHADLYSSVAMTSPWVAYLDDAASIRWSDAAHGLEAVLDDEPETRPARILPVQPIEDKLNGRPADSFGFLGTGYYLSSYTAFVPVARLEAQTDPLLLDYLAMPWTGWVVPCGDRCEPGSAVAVPPTSAWGEPATSVRTTRYGVDSIDYRVELDRASILIENELNSPGWQSSSPNVSLIEYDGAFRAWLLEPGAYSFTAEYRDESLGEQAILLAATFLLLSGLAAAVVVERRSRATR